MYPAKYKRARTAKYARRKKDGQCVQCGVLICNGFVRCNQHVANGKSASRRHRAKTRKG